MYAIAKFDCRADSAEDLDFEKGDVIINVSAVGEGWMKGQVKGTVKTGLFPENYVDLHEGDYTPPPALMPKPNRVIGSSIAPTMSGSSKPPIPLRGTDKPPTPLRQPTNTIEQVGMTKPSIPIRAPADRPSAPSIPIRAPAERPNAPSIPARAPTSSSPKKIPDFIPESDFVQYERIFEKEESTKSMGSLSPMTVKKVFSKSQLSPEVLARIWDLADVGKYGRLSKGEFIIGSWLIGEKLREDKGPPPKLDPFVLSWLSSYDSGALNTKSAGKISSAVTSSPPLPARVQPARNVQQPSKTDMFVYANSSEGRQTVSAAVEFSQTDAGKKAAGAAWEHREQITKAAQSEEGKRAMSAAWDNRDKISKASTAGFKAASEAQTKYNK